MSHSLDFVTVVPAGCGNTKVRALYGQGGATGAIQRAVVGYHVGSVSRSLEVPNSPFDTRREVPRVRKVSRTKRLTGVACRSPAAPRESTPAV